MATGGPVPWPALAMLLIGLAVMLLGLAILTGRGRHPSESPGGKRSPDPPSPAPLFTARSRAPGPRATAGSASRPSASSSAPPSPPVAVPVKAVEPAAEEMGQAPGHGVAPDHVQGGPCDWELHVDVADGEPVVVREATGGRACCIHVLRLRSRDPWPAPREHDERTWSGDRTRIGPSRAVSDVRSDRRRVHPEVRGLDLALETTLARRSGPPVVTTLDQAGDADVGGPPAERLWAAHLSRLGDEHVVNDPDPGPARLQTAARSRTDVALHTTRACRGPGHRLDVRAEVALHVEGEASPVSGTRLALPTVAGWVEGDLTVAATEPVEVSAAAEVQPAPGVDGVAGVAVAAAPGAGAFRAGFVGRGEHRVVDDGIDLLVGSAVVADLGLGEVVGPPSGTCRVAVDVSHRVRLVVTPHTTAERADGGDGVDLGCACAPTYEVHFGAPPQGRAAAAAHAALDVDGRSFRLVATGRDSADHPSWTVQPHGGEDDEHVRGITG